MMVLELFSGTESFSKVAREYGFETFTLEKEERFEPDLCIDILDVNIDDLPKAEIIWASPPCNTFSVASIPFHWDKHKPKSEQCYNGLRILLRTIEIIFKLKPKYWFIENPMSMTRKKIDYIFKLYGLNGYVRHLVTYCQYGDTRRKPTDIWTNCKKWNPKPACNNGDSCHESAPRGSKTSGTQGLKNSEERAIIPRELCEEIILTILNRGPKRQLLLESLLTSTTKKQEGEKE